MSSLFFQQSLFAVVGASDDRGKFGNKVLRCYKQHGFSAVPINKRSSVIEEIPCEPSLTEWCQKLSATGNNLTSNINEDAHDASKNKIKTIGVSIITSPGVTKLIIEEGLSLGIKHFYLQPGTYDSETDDYILSKKKDFGSDLNIVKSCVLIDLGFNDI